MQRVFHARNGKWRNIVAIGLFVFVMGATLSGQESSPWIDLFDGQSLEGWTQRGGKATYEVVDGTIVGTAVPSTPNSFLCTDQDFADFELQLEFLVDDELNSGIQIRSASRADYQDGRVHGYQVEIDPNDGRGWSGGIYDEGRAGWLFDLSENEPARKAFRHNKWNSFRILAVGERIQTWINEISAADFTEAEVPSGFIGLQVHSVGLQSKPLTVRWRNIKLKHFSQMSDREDQHE